MKWVWPDQQGLPLIDWIYKSRNITDKEKFCNPQFEDIHDSFLLHDIKKAAKVISESIEKKEKIIIHGDFDVDGITATSIMWMFLHNDLNADVLPYIPSRFNEGYGFSDESIQNMIALGAKLIISVDCGIKDIELVNKYSSQLKFVITDHHTVREFSGEVIDGSKKVKDFLISNKALAVVHPMLNDYPFKEICGAAVSWKVCSALNQYLGLGIDMKKYIDLAALGTVCDVMPLIDENRAIVKLGIDQIKNNTKVGLSELLKITKLDKQKLQSYHLGYVLGPRLNASGRLEDAMDGVRLLTTSSEAFARQLALKLESLNSERKSLTTKYFDIAENIILKDSNKKLLFIVGEDWPEGILGLIAGKLSHKYNRPVIVGSKKGEFVKASARSIETFHIANTLKKYSTLLNSHGGHSQAAGLSFYENNFKEFKEAIASEAENLITDSDLEKLFKIDAIASLEDLTYSTVDNLSQLEPFGEKNTQPIIGLKGIKIRNYNFLGKDKSHIKFNFLNYQEENIDAIAFGMVDKFNKLLKSLSLYSTPLDLAGNLEVNEWRGNKTLTLKLEDFKIGDID